MGADNAFRQLGAKAATAVRLTQRPGWFFYNPAFIISPRLVWDSNFVAVCLGLHSLGKYSYETGCFRS